MTIQPNEVPHGAAPQFVARYAMQLADNIPQRDIDPRDGCRPHDSRPMPEVLPPHHLPQMLNAGGVLANQELGNIFDRPDHTAGMPLQRRFAPAEQTRLIGQHFHEHPVPHPRMTDERFDAVIFMRVVSLRRCAESADFAHDPGSG